MMSRIPTQPNAQQSVLYQRNFREQNLNQRLREVQAACSAQQNEVARRKEDLQRQQLAQQEENRRQELAAQEEQKRRDIALQQEQLAKDEEFRRQQQSAQEETNRQQQALAESLRQKAERDRQEVEANRKATEDLQKAVEEARQAQAQKEEQERTANEARETLRRMNEGASAIPQTTPNKEASVTPQTIPDNLPPSVKTQMEARVKEIQNDPKLAAELKARAEAGNKHPSLGTIADLLSFLSPDKTQTHLPVAKTSPDDLPVLYGPPGAGVRTAVGGAQL
jgi:hypothetical protein